MENDRELVRRVVAGDRRAFRDLVHAHQRLVVHIVARMLPDSRDREELCQDVFVRVHDRLPSFRFEARLSTWIARIAYRLTLNALERKGPVMVGLETLPRASAAETTVDEFEPSGPDVSPHDPLDRMRTGELTLVVHEAVGSLPVGYRTAVTLFYLQEQTVQEIGQIMDLPLGTVKSYLFRARRLLREHLLARYAVEDLQP